MRALLCDPSVITPAWLPVKLIARQPRSVSAMLIESHADPLAGGEEHVELAAIRSGTDFVGESHELIGGFSHR